MTKPIKRRWHDPITGYKLSAGGILFYDDEGIWTIGESVNSFEIEYTDIGGKYNPDDCNIWSTIRRELEEETYGMCDITTSQIKKFMEIQGQRPSSLVYVEGHNNQPVYVCIVTRLPSTIILREDIFLRLRDMVLAQNPDVPPSFYKPLCLKKIRYSELKTNQLKLSSRLRKILVSCEF